MTISEKDLAMSEDAIELLARVLDIPEKEIVSILERGIELEYERPLSDIHQYFIDEMNATYD